MNVIIYKSQARIEECGVLRGNDEICIYGAGAIGGYIGVLMKLAGADVSLIARGAHLEAIRKNGLKLHVGGEEKNRQG